MKIGDKLICYKKFEGMNEYYVANPGDIVEVKEYIGIIVRLKLVDNLMWYVDRKLQNDISGLECVTDYFMTLENYERKQKLNTILKN